MRIQVLGCYGAEMPGYKTSGFLINDDTLLDAGTVVSVLNVEEQLKINNIIISHTHLDHIKDIQFLADNVIGKRNGHINLIGTHGVLDILRANVLNNIIWPDFTTIPSVNGPILKLLPVKGKEELCLGDVTVKPIRVNHIVDATGYIIKDNDGAIVYTGDTSHTDWIWDAALKEDNLKAIFIEASFPNSMADLAAISGHLTVQGMAEELKKAGDKKVPVYVFHMKPQYLDIIEKEIALLDNKRIKVLKQGDVIEI
ncbi:MAG: 3',5'-cyclic-nucleotide phosphodiesterase [Deltaproteobacteria bacterium]|nr:3',5'-cyclic-nucleotide phosphodiesterase [Deltaproteobacteria bacterium]